MKQFFGVQNQDLTSCFHNNIMQQDEWQNGKVDPNRTLWHRKFNFSLNWQELKQIKFTLFITLLCVVIYCFEVIGFEYPILESMHYPIMPYQQNDWWRYVSHTLVHLSFMHIVFNLMWWWLFGAEIERQCGTFKLVLIYFMGAIVSGMTQNYLTGPDFFGLSGVVYAVLGYVLMVDKFSPNHRFNLPAGFFSMLLIGIALGFATPLMGFQTGNAAHISGLLTGLVLGLFDVIRFKEKS